MLQKLYTKGNYLKDIYFIYMYSVSKKKDKTMGITGANLPINHIKVDSPFLKNQNQSLIQKGLEEAKKAASEEQSKSAGDTFKSTTVFSANIGSVNPSIVKGNQKTTTKTQDGDSDNSREVKDNKKKSGLFGNNSIQQGNSAAKSAPQSSSAGAMTQPQLNPSENNVVISKAAENFFAEKTEETDDDKEVTSSSETEEAKEGEKTQKTSAPQKPAATNPIRLKHVNNGGLSLQKLNSLAAASQYNVFTSDPTKPVKVDSLICQIQSGNALGNNSTVEKTETDAKLVEIERVTDVIVKGDKLGTVVTNYNENVKRDSQALRSRAAVGGYSWTQSSSWQNIKAEPKEVTFKSDYNLNDTIERESNADKGQGLLSKIASFFGSEADEESVLV